MEETTKDLKRDNPEIKDKLIADYLARAYNVITLVNNIFLNYF